MHRSSLNPFNILRGSIGTRLGFGFGCIVLILAGFGGYSVQKIDRLSRLTTQLYEHPFTVNTAVLRIKGNIIAMHRSMKDVALATNNQEIEAAYQKVNESEQLVLEDFEIVYAQFLGDKTDIEMTREEFVNWRPIREQVVQLSLANRKTEAAEITKQVGADYVNSLLADVEAIELFAQGKALEFLNDAQTARQRAIQITSLLILIAITISVILAVNITRPITESLRNLVQLNEKLSRGQLNLDIGTKTQIHEVEQLLISMQTMLTQLRQIVSKVKLTVEQMQQQSNLLTSSVDHITSGVTEQAAATEQASASIQSMISNIQQNTYHAKETETIAHQSATDAEHTRQSMLEAVQVMNSIIKQTSIVQEIAQETNMLAINAGIETSRQHQAGQGFSVISSEIRKLAERSREVTRGIDVLASTSVMTVGKAETMLNQLMPGIQTTSDLVKDISTSSAAQLSSSHEIGQSIDQLETVTQHNSELADDLSSIAKGLAKQAQELQRAIAFFDL